MSDPTGHAIRPIGARYLVEQEKFTPGGGLIAVPDEATALRPLGTVIAVGHGVESSEISVGDRVCFNELAGDRVKLGDQEFLLVSHSDILAVVVTTKT